MKNKNFIDKIRQNVTVNGERTAEFVEMTATIIANILAEGDSLSIKKFGSFEVRKKEERISVNPATGIRWMIPPKLVPGFKPGPTMKEKLKSYTGNE